MKKWYVLFPILIIFLSSKYIKPEEFYFINIRQSLTNYTNTSIPNIDLELKSILDKRASVTFRTSLLDLYPSEFILSLDSLRTGAFKHKLFLGDYYYPSLGFSKIRGLGYSMNYTRFSFGITGGQSKDLFFSRFPTFEHNKSQLLFFSGYSFSINDTSSIYIISRIDDNVYNDYTEKVIYGIRHKSEISRVLRISTDIRKSDYYADLNNYSVISGSYNINTSLGKFAFNLRGEYMPVNYISPSNIVYNRGRFVNMLSGGLRVTDELSVYANYQLQQFYPDNSLSQDRYGIRISAGIPYLPHLTVSYDYSRYLLSNIKKDMTWRFNAYRRFGPLFIDIMYSNFSNASTKRHNISTAMQYIFSNASRTGMTFNYSNTNSVSDFRYAAYIAWSPIGIWDIETGVDYTIANQNSYLTEYIQNSIILNNMTLSTQMNIRFQEETYIRFTVNLSFRNRLTDFHIASLTGRVFYDNNQNGKYDEGEETVPGIGVELNDSIHSITGKNGIYVFRFMKPDIYTLRLDKGKLPAYLDVENEISIGLKNLQTKRFDIPLIKMSSITGFVFEDENKDGVRQIDEAGLKDIIVRLKDTDVYTYTDANGYYILSNLPQGNYILEIPRMPEDYDYSIPNLINYISIKSVKGAYNVDFGLVKESKPVRTKIF